MNVKRCANGHFFDADKYQLCPHCGASIENVSNTSQQATQGKRDKHPAKRKREESTESIIRPMPQKTMGKTFGVFDEPEQTFRPGKSVRVTAGYNPSENAEEKKAFRPCPKCGKTISAQARFCKHCGLSISEETETPVIPSVTDKKPSDSTDEAVGTAPAHDLSKQLEEKEHNDTCPFCGEEILDDDIFCIHCGKRLPEAKTPVWDENVSEQPKAPPVIETSNPSRPAQNYDSAKPSADSFAAEPEKGAESVSSSSTAAPSLEAAVKSAVSGNDGRTIGFFSMGSSGNTNSDVDPVVGWLVCVKGKHFGESFPIAAGRNSVGRGASNKIMISGDNSVSREKHAWITYDPRHRVFFIQPGEGSGLSYLNGETVMETKKMAAKDKIEIGDGMYLLIPLCDESFSWEDYIK